MKVIGIIAEYNPFHNGHAYQIKKIKEDLQADYVVVAMSGDFVQRGAPAIIDKYTRAKMALSCGADLVIELPVLWATASAEYFAMAGVTLFDKMGCVDGICFGAETDDLNALSAIADILVTEPDSYRKALSSNLKTGMAFPAARCKALCDSFAIDSSILNEPNNILAIEYLKALKRRDSSITPYVIKREGAGYHDETITDDTACNVPTASATAIRKALDSRFSSTELAVSETLISSMPASVLEILKEYIAEKSLIYTDAFSSILGYRLLTSDTTVLANIGDSNSDIANRIFKNRMNFVSFEQFCDLNKSKDVTYTRMSRILLHLILNIVNSDYSFGKELDYVPYIRILGFKKEASALLKELKKASKIPIISKLADASSLLDENAMTLLEKDIFAADLYSQVCAARSGNTSVNDYSRNIVLI